MLIHYISKNRPAEVDKGVETTAIKPGETIESTF